MDPKKKTDFWQERDNFLVGLELTLLNNKAALDKTTWDDIEDRLDAVLGRAIAHGIKLREES